jgi:transcriptional regulator with XRE-family HTH domain
MNIARNLKRLRKERGYTQGELAKKINAHMGHISRIETGKYNPSVDILIKLAEALEVTLDSMVGQNPDATNEEIKIEDQILSEKIKLLNTLDEEERFVVIKVIDAMLTKKRVLSALQTKA